MKNNTVRSFVDAPAAADTATAKPSRQRMRRNRRHDWTRRLVSENAVTVNDLVWPVFVLEGNNIRQDIPSMQGVSRWSLDLLLKEIEGAATQGIPAIALFPVIDGDKKTPDGREAWANNNLVTRAVMAIKKEFPDVGVICDVALDPYTSHGHDGILDDSGYVANDITVAALCRQALSQAAAGVDIVAPSDMMDHRVAAIRDALDEHGFTETAILSYTAKYASSFYGPFRDAVQSGDRLQGDKKTYQMDPANADEAMREAAADVEEGADMLMVKPGLPYLDIVRQVKDVFGLPIFAYHVSGEYAMLKAASQQGWLDHDKALLEIMTSFKRAGCDGIFTYAARDVARLVKTQG